MLALLPVAGERLLGRLAQRRIAIRLARGATIGPDLNRLRPRRPTSLVTGATARALAVAAGVALLGGCGDADEGVTPTADTKPHRTAAKLTPYPTNDERPVESGVTYTTAQFRPHLAITVRPGAWVAETGDRPDHVSIARDIGRGQAILAFHHMTRVFDPRRGGETPGEQVAGPSDFAAWLVAHPHLRTTRPVAVERLGMRGLKIEVTTRSSAERTPDACLKLAAPPCVALFHDGFDFAVYPSDARTRFYVLGKPGDQLVVEEWVEPTALFTHQVCVLERQLNATRPALS